MEKINKNCGNEIILVILNVRASQLNPDLSQAHLINWICIYSVFTSIQLTSQSYLWSATEEADVFIFLHFLSLKKGSSFPISGK